MDAGKGAVDVISRIRQTWLENIEKYLRSAGTTIAVVNLDLMLERGGLLDSCAPRDTKSTRPDGRRAARCRAIFSRLCPAGF